MVKSQPDGLSLTFGALSDPTRRAILARLARGAATVGELAEPFAISLPAISKHLGVLEEAGLVERAREGRTIRCRLEGKPLEDAESWIERHRRFWNAQLDALGEYLEQPKERRNGRRKNRK
ncbi:MAG TPA: metalloregulator ArsR/SmtB family transcription factor [Alphaproteobacteria bacterium]|jgi:DNA-binding transcriptional ArsR family regulator